MTTAFVTGGTGFVGRNLIRALVARGVDVRALSRSEQGDALLSGIGAKPIRGDLDNADIMHAAMRGCDVVFHSAAKVEEWGDPASYWHINVEGTKQVIHAARLAAVPTLVHVSTEAVLADGQPLVAIDEAQPYPEDPIPRYPETKAAAERLVLAANSETMRTVVIRPRFIWGADDTSLLPQLVDAVDSGRFMWIDGGHYLTSTTHVWNVVEGLILGWERGKGGEVYFVTDGEPVEFRSFITALLETQGIELPNKSVPLWLIRPVAAVGEAIWTALNFQKPPPATRVLVGLVGQEVTISDAKARRELGYTSGHSREQGLAEMRQQAGMGTQSSTV